VFICCWVKELRMEAFISAHGAPASYMGPTHLGYINGVDTRDQSDSDSVAIDTYAHTVNATRLQAVSAGIAPTQFYARASLPLAPDSVVIPGMITAYDLHTDAARRDAVNPALVANLAHTDFVVDKNYSINDLATGFSPWEAGGLLPLLLDGLAQSTAGRGIYACLQDSGFIEQHSYLAPTRFSFAGVSIVRATVPGTVVSRYMNGGPTGGLLTVTVAGIHEVNTFNALSIPSGTTVYLDTPTDEEGDYIRQELGGSVTGSKHLAPFVLRSRNQLFHTRPWINNLKTTATPGADVEIFDEFLELRKVGTTLCKAGPYGKVTIRIKG
jgi:hypothetical protein